MSPAEAVALGAWIRQARDALDLSILIIEHHVPLIATLCSKVYVLEFGRMLAVGTPAEIRSNPDVVTAFLGAGEG
jgi:branched-chain amino acid transport system ATP-binding protein